jgi:hypothetical protein
MKRRARRKRLCVFCQTCIFKVEGEIVQQSSIIVCPRLTIDTWLVVTLFLAYYLEVLERCLFVWGEMSEMALRISVLNNCRLDSVCGAIGRHDCVKYTK